jgi:hypothetical protein
MTYTRDPEIAALIDEVVSMAPPPPELPNPSVRSRARRRSTLVLAGVALTGIVAAVLIVAPWSSGSRKPPIIAPAISGPEQLPLPLPLLVPGPDATIDRVDINDASPTTPQPITYVQVYSAGASQSGPHLEVATTDWSPTGRTRMTLEDLGCNPATNPGLASDHLHDGQIIDLDGHQACLVTNVADQLSLHWIDTDGIAVAVTSTGLSVAELETIGGGMRRSTGTQGVQVPLLRGLEEVARGEIPDGSRGTYISFHRGTCTYDLLVEAANPSSFGFGEPVDINGATGRLHGNVLAWNPASGSTAELLGHIGHEPFDSAYTAATECEMAAVARQVVQIDGATWQQTLDALGDRVHRASAASNEPVPTMPSMSPAG